MDRYDIEPDDIGVLEEPYSFGSCDEKVHCHTFWIYHKCNVMVGGKGAPKCPSNGKYAVDLST